MTNGQEIPKSEVSKHSKKNSLIKNWMNAQKKCWNQREDTDHLEALLHLCYYCTFSYD